MPTLCSIWARELEKQGGDADFLSIVSFSSSSLWFPPGLVSVDLVFSKPQPVYSCPHSLCALRPGVWSHSLWLSQSHSTTSLGAQWQTRCQPAHNPFCISCVTLSGLCRSGVYLRWVWTIQVCMWAVQFGTWDSTYFSFSSFPYSFSYIHVPGFLPLLLWITAYFSWRIKFYYKS